MEDNGYYGFDANPQEKEKFLQELEENMEDTLDLSNVLEELENGDK